MDFTHLHTHSQFSTLDGAIKLKDLYKRLHEYKMNSVAVTDHGNMFCAIDFYKSAKKNDIKPIIGMEAYICQDMYDRSGRNTFHLILLAKNNIGYKNLIYLSSMGYLEGFYYTPRIDKKLLRKRSGGLIGLSACMGGEIPRAITRRGTQQATELVREYVSIFDPGCFFLEIQANGLKEQDQVNDELIKIARKESVGLVATNDCHYLERKDARAHEILMCIQTGQHVRTMTKMKQDTDQLYVKSPREMERYFSHVPQAIEATQLIADMCNVELDLSKTYMPKYNVPKDHTLESYMEKKAREGLEDRFREFEEMGMEFDREVYRDRLSYEMSVILAMGFAGYMLIVWDFIKFAKDQNIPVGPSRGSGGGSLVAYALKITDLNPIPYDLLFERFLNPDRVSMPDFDIDFCIKHRSEVIKYVAQKYGEKNIGQIATFFTLKARSVVRDVARVLEFDIKDADTIAKLIPEAVQGKSPTVPEAIKQVPELAEMAKKDDQVADLLDIAASLEGLTRHVGVHAAGVVIGEKHLWEYVPCCKDKEGNIVSQFSMNDVEQAGLVKFDFLGLKTLTVIDLAISMIDKEIKINMIPLDDPDVYKVICSGHTAGIFQIEGRGFTELIKRLKPNCFEDIVAAVALYRPGPLEGGMVDDFIDRKHGKKKIKYPHPSLEKILKPTYGVIVYQEQVMQIAQVLSGYSLGMADIMRKIVGKKKLKEMPKQEKIFVEGAIKNNVDEKTARDIFNLIKVFASYGFCRSHSAAYGMITYQTAYLKTYYPSEFMAAVLTCEKDSIESLSRYIEASKDIGIKILRPDINESLPHFSVAGSNKIRFGLSALKNVGSGVAELITEIRRSKPFVGMFDFYERTNSKCSNKKVVESLIKGGAFDDVSEDKGISRAQMVASMKDADMSAKAIYKDRKSGQTNIFDILEDEEDPDKVKRYQDIPDWSQNVKLAFEKESLGFYVSGHPLDQFKEFLRKHANTSTKNIRKRTMVKVGGIISNYREYWLKSGDGKLAVFDLEDWFGSVACVAFKKEFEAYKEILKSTDPVFVEGMIKMEERGGARLPKIFLRRISVLQKLNNRNVKEILVRVNVDKADEGDLVRFKSILLEHPGECMVRVRVIIPGRSYTNLTLSDKYLVTPSDELTSKIQWIFGKDSVVI